MRGFLRAMHSTKKTLLLGVDGCRPDCLLPLQAPNITRLKEKSAFSFNAQVRFFISFIFLSFLNSGRKFSGHHLRFSCCLQKTCQVTMSGPSWTSCVTGVWEDKHEVLSNDTMGQAKWDRYPSLFQRIKSLRPDTKTAIVASWGNFVDLRDQVDTAWFLADIEQDELTASEICNLLKEENTPDVLFGHLDAIDHAGHLFGYGTDIPEYMEVKSSQQVTLGYSISGCLYWTYFRYHQSKKKTL